MLESLFSEQSLPGSWEELECLCAVKYDMTATGVLPEELYLNNKDQRGIIL